MVVTITCNTGSWVWPCATMIFRIRGSFTSLQRYSSSLSSSFSRNELQERVKKLGIELHFPREVQVNTHSLALLVGWAESRQKVMAKFAAIYTRQGIPCLTIAPSIVPVWFTSIGNKLTSNLLTSVDSATPLSEQPMNLVMHLFSAAGTAVFPKLVEDLAKPNGILTTKIQPKCIIYDSGPVVFSYQTGMAAANLVYKQGGFSYPTYVASKFVGSMVNVLIGSRKRSELTNALNSPLFDVPQLYLFSKADSVSSSEMAEEIMEKQRRRGRSVESFCWEDSEHVRHLTQHPEQYEKLVVDFLRKHDIIKPNWGGLNYWKHD